MGRKRDKGVDGPSKRKTILQIGKSTTNSTHADSPGHAGAGAKPKATHNPLGLLANYGDSDDEGADEDVPTPPRPTKAGFIGVDGTKPENEMDAKVLDFLAEIDALDPEDADEQPSEPSNGAPLQEEPAPAAEAPPPPPAPIDNGGWQELLDENTNCIYYWNTETNAVTWETPEGFQPVDATEPAPPPPEPEETPTPTQPQEPIPEPEEPATQPITEEPKPEPKKVVKEETQKEVLKMVPVSVKVALKKAPELDMFADEVKKEEATKEASKVMPVYGTLKVDYDIEEDEEDEEEEEEEEVEPPTKKLGAYSMFVKGDTMPSSIDGDDEKSSKKSSESKMQLSHYDVAFDEDEDDDDAMDSRTNGDAGSDEEDDDDVVEMDAADELDIDQQLELALERKKAELAHLEDMEKGGSSPSQMKRRMSSPLNIYDEKGEVNLLSFKKKRLENLKGQKQVQTCDQGTQCDKELDKVAAEDEKYQSAKKIKDETKLKKELSELGSILTGKLEFLGQSRKGLSKLQILLVELETRILDWREGALDGKHLLRKLQLADWELQKNEAEAVPPGWTCTWNRTYKQYYYTNSDTEESQWDYPTDALTGQEEDKWEQSKRQRVNSAMFNRASSQDDTQARARGSTSMMHGSVISEQLTSIIAAAPSPPPPPAPSETIPPPPGPQYNAPPLPNDPPPPGTGPDLPPLPPSPPPMPPSPPAPPDDSDSDDSEGPSSRPLTPPPLPPSVPPFAAVTLAGPPPPPEPDDGTVIGAPQILYTNAPITAGATIGRPLDASGLDGTPVGDYGGAPVPYGGQVGSGEPSGVGQPTVTKVKKTKKKVKKSAVKKKMPSSLVEKWKQIQEAQIKEEEEKRRREEEEDMVIDPSVIQQKRIADWKKQQMEKGVTAHNPNFEMIHGDWRERLKRKGPK